MVNQAAIKERLHSAVTSYQPNELANVFALPGISQTKTKSVKKARQSTWMVGENDLGGLLACLFDVHSAAEAGDAAECYQAQSGLHSAFNRLFSSSEGNWMVPALIVVCKNTHRVALAADRENTNPTQKNAKLQSAVQLLQDSYSKTFNDRTEYQPKAPFNTEGSKKAGVLAVVNELFGMYFRLNLLRLCKNLIRPVETRKLNESGTMGQMVTYRYYIGRVNMFEDQHELAEKNLDFAFNHCHRNSIHNKKCILRYLVPVKLYRGRLPTPYCKFFFNFCLWRENE